MNCQPRRVDFPVFCTELAASLESGKESGARNCGESEGSSQKRYRFRVSSFEFRAVPSGFSVGWARIEGSASGSPETAYRGHPRQLLAQTRDLRPVTAN